MGDREEGNVVPEPSVCPTESKESTTESVTQEYKFIFPFFSAPFLAVTLFCYFAQAVPCALFCQEAEQLLQQPDKTTDT